MGNTPVEINMEISFILTQYIVPCIYILFLKFMSSEDLDYAVQTLAVDAYGPILSFWSFSGLLPVHFQWKKGISAFINIYSFVFHGRIEGHIGLEDKEGQ